MIVKGCARGDFDESTCVFTKGAVSAQFVVLYMTNIEMVNRSYRAEVGIANASAFWTAQMSSVSLRLCV